MAAKRKRFLILFACWMTVAFSLASCANHNDTVNKEENRSDVHEQGGNPKQENADDAYAKELINKAFAYEVPNEITPTTEFAENRTIIRYTVEKEKFYIVELDEDLEFPAMVYCFCHIGEDEGFDLAEESSDYFNDRMISKACDFVENLYEIDCSDATVHAYGYKNKIAVQLEIDEDKVFQVRFYYKEREPVGVVFYNDIDAFEKFLETYQAKQYM